MSILRLMPLLLALLFFKVEVSTAEPILFAPLPINTKEALFGSHLPLVQYLNRKTALQFELTYISDYQTLFNEFKKGNINIITTGPLPYIELKKTYPPAKAILHFKDKDNSTHYSCVLVTSANGPSRLANIKGPIALTQKSSTCGYFSANIILSKAGKDIKKLNPTHLKTHNEVVESVIRGEFEVGSLKKDIAEQYKGYAIKFLAESSKWPNFAIVVNTRYLSADTIQKIKDALLNISPEDAKTLVVGKYGFVQASEEDFDTIKKYYEKYR